MMVILITEPEPFEIGKTRGSYSLDIKESDLYLNWDDPYQVFQPNLMVETETIDIDHKEIKP